MSPEAERELFDYLHAQKVADVAGTLVKLMNWTQEHAKENAVNHEEIKGALRGHSLRIGALEKNDDRIDTRLQESGNWNIESIHARQIAIDDAKWWKEKAITIIVGLVMLLLGGAGSLFFRR